jgi:hypothetical protein
MLYQKTIRQIIALVMLLVFAFSITPQKSIHDLVAKHSDPAKCNVHKDAPIAQVEKSSIHCSYDNLVVASPFLDFSCTHEVVAPPVRVIKNTSLIALTYLLVPFPFESRGPPVVIG